MVHLEEEFYLLFINFFIKFIRLLLAIRTYSYQSFRQSLEIIIQVLLDFNEQH